MLKDQKKGEKSGIYKNCEVCGTPKYIYRYLIPRTKYVYCSFKCMGIAQRGKPTYFSKNIKKGICLNTGKTQFKKGMKATQHKILKGKEHYNWKGGITAINHAIRESFEYEEWRKAVFERDNYTCQSCKEVGGKLQADHIKPFALFPELRLEFSNGRTLCEYCHWKIGAKVNQYSKREDFEGGNLL